jgi:hypothetical protein
MEHNSTKALGETLDVFAYAPNINTFEMYKLVGYVLTDITPAYVITEISTDICKVNVTLPNEDCIVCAVLNGQPVFMRVGTPDTQYVAYAFGTGKTIPYERISITGSVVQSGNLVEYGHGIYGFALTSSEYSVIKSGGYVCALDVPYNEICIETPTGDGSEGADANFINVGYNMFGFTGNRYSYHNGTAWVADAGSEAKASDLAKAVAYKYGLEWSDKANPMWIGNYVKYIRTYVENDGQFKFYSPSVTPETNTNNFSLVQTDEKGNEYVRGVSILLVQELETGGAEIPFREV